MSDTNSTQVYEYVDENMKRAENILTVDFHFSTEVTADEAIAMVDKMVSMLDDSTDAVAKEFTAHRPSIYSKYPVEE